MRLGVEIVVIGPCAALSQHIARITKQLNNVLYAHGQCKRATRRRQAKMPVDFNVWISDALSGFG